MNPSSGSFHRSLNLFDSTAIVMGSMIGSGIFIVSADIARHTGAPGWLLMVWAITGIMTVFASLSYGELAGMMPKAGGTYVYLREAYSPLFGFLYGWTLFLAVQCGTIAAVAMAFSKYLGVLCPWISEYNIFFELGQIKINFTQVIAIISIMLLTWVNSRGIEQGKKIQNIFTFSKILIILLLIAVGFAFSKGFQATDWWDTSKTENDLHLPLEGFALMIAIGISMVGSLFSSDAWYNITFASGEVINPKRNIPMSLFLGTLIVAILYFLVNVVYIKILPVTGHPNGLTDFEQGIQYASEDRVAAAVMNQILGRSGEVVIALIIIISTFGCNNGIILSGARVYYAMACDGIFFKNVTHLNDKGVPAVSLWVQAIWSTILCLSGTYSQLLDYVIFTALIFNILTILSVFILRIRRPDLERPYKTIGYPVIPMVYITVCFMIEIILLIYKPKFTWPGLIIVMTGIPVYYLWKYYPRLKSKFYPIKNHK
jgi:basic amino acid/polyamine antiporter, APA family